MTPETLVDLVTGDTMYAAEGRGLTCEEYVDRCLAPEADASALLHDVEEEP